MHSLPTRFVEDARPVASLRYSYIDATNLHEYASSYQKFLTFAPEFAIDRNRMLDMPQNRGRRRRPEENSKCWPNKDKI
jgi:hypothetical protein